MKKILFVIPNLMHGGAERVLVNLVNSLDQKKFDVHLLSLFDCGVNRESLKPHVKYRFIFQKQFRGNSHFFKLFSPEHLYKKYISEHYDLVVAFLEGVAARIVSGCPDANTKKICWIHISLATKALFAQGFRSSEEAVSCYDRFDRFVCVSESVKKDWLSVYPAKSPVITLYNPIDSEKIRRLALAPSEYPMDDGKLSICAIGRLIPDKGIDRLIEIASRLKKEGIGVHFYIGGTGSQEAELRSLIEEKNIGDIFTMLGFLENPYALMSRCDFLVCASYREGFSSVCAEALICGIPVITVDVHGAREVLPSCKAGQITANDTDSLYEAIRNTAMHPEILAEMKKNAKMSTNRFDMQKAVGAIEDFFLSLF